MHPTLLLWNLEEPQNKIKKVHCCLRTGRLASRSFSSLLSMSCSGLPPKSTGRTSQAYHRLASLSVPFSTPDSLCSVPLFSHSYHHCRSDPTSLANASHRYSRKGLAPTQLPSLGARGWGHSRHCIQAIGCTWIFEGYIPFSYQVFNSLRRSVWDSTLHHAQWWWEECHYWGTRWPCMHPNWEIFGVSEGSVGKGNERNRVEATTRCASLAFVDNSQFLAALCNCNCIHSLYKETKPWCRLWNYAIIFDSGIIRHNLETNLLSKVLWISWKWGSIFGHKSHSWGGGQ